jgi:Protein of unknown function (DUF2742)
MPPDSRVAAPEGTATQHDRHVDSTYLIGSQQVSWWSVHEFTTGILAAVDNWPMVGTPAWCELDAGDVRKIAAVFDAARHWALRVETCQEARVDTGETISAAYDWTAIAQEKFRLDCAIAHGTYIPRVAS